MNLFTAGLIIVGVAAVTIGAMLLVRRTAPEGSYFQDGDRAAGVFGVLSTGFAILLGFVVFLAFSSYDISRSGAEDEAQIVAQQFQTAQLLPEAARKPLSESLVCYARAVAYEEWPQMSSGDGAGLVNPWSVVMFRTLQTIEPRKASEQAAYGKWLDQQSERQVGRSDRTHGAEGVIPAPLWIVLFLLAGIIFVFMLLFADSAERALRPGDDDGRGRGHDLVDAPPALVPRQPVPLELGRPSPRGDGTDARAARPGGQGGAPRARASLRRARKSHVNRGSRYLVPIRLDLTDDLDDAERLADDDRVVVDHDRWVAEGSDHLR